MPTFTVLGAGAMGTALCKPFIDAGWEVRLWGTWLDDHLIDAIEAGQPHPRIKVAAAPGIRTFRSGQLAEALEGADVVDIAVTSEGLPRVTEMALDHIAGLRALCLTAKGFWTDPEGRIRLLPDAIRAIADQKGVSLPPLVAVGGPVKANECAAGEVTATTYASRDLALAETLAREAATDTYGIRPSDDETGVELCAALKNVYAISLGIADGLGEATGVPRHNLKAAAFAQAIREMSLLVAAVGGHSETPYGLAGVGDLEVTGLSGRNKLYGVRLGKGETPDGALAEMNRLEQTVEGYPAAPLAVAFAHQAGADEGTLPLLHAVARILQGGVDDVYAAVAAAVKPARP
ncbi:NAD(P)H-dependent glycerol-3-phosphate dehydrogenase [Acidipropionibacterium jensenii]|uniref:Glycerol-3-phosphate dehydrogenase n=1 Tax=Acidipropionibacterium jensenii TaxID=1749 RepID=A0A3S5EV86_9ACTN|nr:NAD(P)H-dependent glycerol-3-phosphate dehydrogenase [Acidipropionibacterium jensenii]AZZ38444.1 glycerol-3-phosphate dehydrogenase [Acidipropionibacterium jensenii]MDN5977814.1 glycerol-3-phosphate dehydrogenase [Acidipropionibacterium jensenii]MDN5995527.1 glycerol-3-phosphate dehydrogenase [Acidipropionibacterium jensenii]MDN6020923.1 glycerol-3-phosphate dehydrogenase [Acidipropionibacterium jensenii]MDN6427169.1 glycerol-3-phosphate dehydrogenase [Acidipropionibacterium jensenii]